MLFVVIFLSALAIWKLRVLIIKAFHWRSSHDKNRYSIMRTRYGSVGLHNGNGNDRHPGAGYYQLG